MAEKELALCNECGSLFFKGSSQMTGLCPECAHVLYGYPNCDHHFQDGRCVNCYWDGSKSEYIKKQNQQEETDMPTTEWLNKYEAIKDKLTCKDDLEAHFTEKVIGNMAVDVLDIGAVHFPTGTIFACDPLVELEDTSPFIQTIPAGTYPVKICVVPSEKYGDRYACVKVEVSQEKPVRYGWAWWATRIWTRRWEMTTTSVSAWMPGWGVLQTSRPRRPLRHTGPSGWRRTRTSTPTTTCSAIFWRKTPKPTPNIKGTAATGSTGQCRTRTATCPSSPLAGVMVLSRLLRL